MSLQSSMQDYYDDLAYASRQSCFRSLSISSLWCVNLPNIWPFSRAEYEDVDQDYPVHTNGGYQQYQPSGAALPTAQPIFSSHLASAAFSGSSLTSGDYSGASSSNIHFTHAFASKRRIDEDLYADRMMRQDSRLEDEDEFVSTVDRKAHKSSSKPSRKESKKDRSSSSRSHRSSSSKASKSRSSKKASSSTSPTKLSSSPSVSPAILHRDEDASSGESSEDDELEIPARKPSASPIPSAEPVAAQTEPADVHERALPSS